MRTHPSSAPRPSSLPREKLRRRASLLCTRGRRSAALALCILLLASCGGNQQTEEEETPWQAPEAVDTIIALDARRTTATITLRQAQLTYICSIAPDTLLPVVTNPDGQRYFDNTATLTVRRGGNILIERSFTKRDFANYVPPKQMNSCVLAGLTYDELAAEQHDDALRFIATVGDPDEANGVNFPVELIVSPDGGLRMEQAEDIETAPLHPGLNEPPEN